MKNDIMANKFIKQPDCGFCLTHAWSNNLLQSNWENNRRFNKRNNGGS